jgi:hypothetical protein
MSLQVTNQKSSPALRGGAALVTLNGTEAVSKLPQIAVGYKATMGSSSNVGYVSSVDPYGYSFEVTPRNPDERFESITPGYLNSGELITITF